MLVSYHEMTHARIGFLLLGPPCGQQHILIRLRGGGPKCLKICSKIQFLNKSRCVAGLGFWSNLIQIEASSPLGPPLRPATHRESPPGRGGQMFQILFKKQLFEQLSVCCLPRILVQIAPNRGFFTCGPPPSGQQYVEIRLRGGVSKYLQISCKDSLLEPVSVCCWPRIVVKIDPKRRFFTSGVVSLAPLCGQNSIALASWGV